MAELEEQSAKAEQERKTIRIIYIEDDINFRDLTLRWFRKNPNNIEIISWFPDTEKAEEYLKKQQEENQELPDAIVTDQNLGAKRDGIGFAQWVQSQKALNKIGDIPVILFSTDSIFSFFTKEDLAGTGLAAFVDKGKVQGESESNLVQTLNSLNTK